MTATLLKFFERYQLFIWPIFGVMVVIMLGVFVIYPQANDLISGTQIFSQTRVKVKKLEEKLARLEALDEQGLRSDFGTALIVLPLDRDYVSSLSQLQILTTANSLKIDDVSFGSANILPDQTSNSFLIRLTVLGTVAQIQQLILQLRNSPRIMSVEDIALVGAKGNTPTQAVLTLKTYYQPTTTSLGDILSPLAELSDNDYQLLSQLNQSLQDVPITLEEGVTGVTGKTDPFQ